MIRVTLLGLILLLSACGKKGQPSPPGPPDEVKVPKIYPAQ